VVGEIERRKAMIDELFDERKFAALKGSLEEQSPEERRSETHEDAEERRRKDQDSERGSTRTKKADEVED
jgi:hypothetical protein